MSILKKLTLKTLKMNKSRTIVTIIGIMLSAALMTTVAGMASSAQNTFIHGEEVIGGNYDLKLSNISADKITKYQSNRDVEGIYAVSEVGCANLEGAKNDKKPFVGVMAYDKDALSDCFTTEITEGRLPKNSDELIVSQALLNNTTKKYKVGDTISLNIGNRPNNHVAEQALESNDSNKPVAETLLNTKEKTYKIVGIIGNSTSMPVSFNSLSASSFSATVYDMKEMPKGVADIGITAYVRYTPSAEKEYFETTKKLLNIDDELLQKAISQDTTPEEEQLLAKTYNSPDIHTTLLRYKGIALGDTQMAMLFMIALVVILIVIIASIFVIRNSFAISITEKTKLYGMLSSTGATSRQIRRNVLFEGFILGIIAIPAGILLGIGVIALLILIMNSLLADFLNGLTFVYTISPISIVIAVVLSALTIFISTIFIAVRASRITPISAIRNSNEIKIKKKKIKSPKFIKKCFGVGGDIAYKNLKRSKKKYRTTVISIVVSVSLFIVMSSFIQYGTQFTSKYYSNINFNLSAEVTAAQNVKEVTKKISEQNNVNGISTVNMYSVTSKALSSSLTSEGKDNITQYDTGNKNPAYTIYAMDTENLKCLAKVIGIDYDTIKDSALVLNNMYYYNDKNESVSGKYFKIKQGDKIDFSTFENDKTISGSLPVGAVYNDFLDDLNFYYVRSGAIVVDSSQMKNYVDYSDNSLLLIKSDKADVLENNIEDLSLGIRVNNIDSTARIMNALVLIISIFAYGFIIVISLIGFTNIFNTITTNMRLRSKEFAMLKSIGMTQPEFNRMIRLESLFYGAKSLLIGIPLGLIGSFLVLQAFNIGNAFAFVFPWQAILISIAFVFIVVWMIMRFSVSKVKKQNIIETIRNDNV